MSNRLDWAKHRQQSGLDWAKHNHQSGKDVAEFQLTAFEKMTRLEMDWWMTSVEYQKQLVEVAIKKVELATNIEKLNQYRAAANEMRKTLRRMQKEYLRAEKKLQKQERSYRHAENLFRGEYISGSSAITRGWNGLLYCCRKLVGVNLINIGMTSASSLDFYHPKKSITKTPQIRSVWKMIHWCKRWGIVPRIGSNAQVELAEIFDIIHEVSETRILDIKKTIDVLRQQTDTARTEFFKLAQSKIE